MKYLLLLSFSLFVTKICNAQSKPYFEVGIRTNYIYLNKSNLEVSPINTGYSLSNGSASNKNFGGDLFAILKIRKADVFLKPFIGFNTINLFVKQKYIDPNNPSNFYLSTLTGSANVFDLGLGLTNVYPLNNKFYLTYGVEFKHELKKELFNRLDSNYRSNSFAYLQDYKTNYPIEHKTYVDLNIGINWSPIKNISFGIEMNNGLCFFNCKGKTISDYRQVGNNGAVLDKHQIILNTNQSYFLTNFFSNNFLNVRYRIN